MGLSALPPRPWQTQQTAGFLSRWAGLSWTWIRTDPCSVFSFASGFVIQREVLKAPVVEGPQRCVCRVMSPGWTAPFASPGTWGWTFGSVVFHLGAVMNFHVCLFVGTHFHFSWINTWEWGFCINVMFSFINNQPNSSSCVILHSPQQCINIPDCTPPILANIW